MNRFIKLFFLDFKLLAKTKTFYLKLLLFPILLILILGYILGSNDFISKFTVVYINKDTAVNNTCLGKALESSFQTKDMKTVIKLKQLNSLAQGKKLIAEKKADVLVYMPSNFTTNYILNRQTDIKLLANNNKQIDKSIVENILDSFKENIQCQMAKIQTGIRNPANQYKYVSLKRTAIIKNAKPISVLQYEVVAMTVFFSILTAFTLVHNIVSDKLNGTLARIKSTPALSLQYVLGKLCGMTLAMTLQMLIVLIISKLCFKVRLGNPAYIIAITVIYTFAIGAIILCWGLSVKDQMSISSIASPVLYGSAFLGGSFINKDALPDFLHKLQQIIPNGIAINSYLNICGGGALSQVSSYLIELVVIAVLFSLIAANIFNRKEGAK